MKRPAIRDDQPFLEHLSWRCGAEEFFGRTDALMREVDAECRKRSLVLKRLTQMAVQHG